MGPFGSQLIETSPSVAIPQQFQRCRNSSGGSFSSTTSTTSSTDMPPSPVFTPTCTPAAFNDINALALLLSSTSLKDNLNLQDSNAKSVGSSRYKTEKCRSYMETGQCKYGDKCQFAHGNHEQRAMPRHPKYKTEYCRTFHTTGLCPYGTRCHFIHNEDPTKLCAITQAKHQYIAQQAAQEIAKQAANFANLRAQQSLIQNQLQAIASQMQNQLAVNMFVKNSVNAAMHQAAQPVMPTLPQIQPQYVPASLPQMMPTTQQLSSQTVLPPMLRESLGSVADTPPVSPPCGSPVFDSAASSPKSSSYDVSPPPGFAPLSGEIKRNISAKSAFDFSAPCASDADFLSQVFFDLDSSCSVSSGYTPPSSPDSFCQSPMESPRSSRLPIFKGIAGDNL